ncbi:MULTISPECIES: peroxiredoxin [unclassified Enterococcus]|uniref:peroxiredoxin n=1 Tax=unclassified Enterococcus TaxID=2608891 RepID=UPI0015571FD0|nr:MULTISPECIES: peroxiredoxin [unclassified Enterococcus]MBS7577200.1 peroxiredoxin [Enterococcus sp. MMGLQ5-2]MBS7584707.1 peroxiredoxin [Enterococcus sp. MMGLQ5-1]NPD12562.1 peroxiredoxin [Enterococcus sp. MMGLQ5-1]NPD37034.1 peroxiredoxin [Enterococcus sp. MMGLQ5-2]
MKISLHGEYAFDLAPISVGETAPNFKLLDQNDQTVELEKRRDLPVILSVFPDINTSVCDLQTRAFNRLASENKAIHFLSISNNTKEEQANWCAAKGVDMTVLHDDANQFGAAYGLFAPELNHLSRAVFVVDRAGKIAYAEVLSEITDEPNYQAALAAAIALS